jgi:hypothetical protein
MPFQWQYSHAEHGTPGIESSLADLSARSSIAAMRELNAAISSGPRMSSRLASSSRRGAMI